MNGIPPLPRLGAAPPARATATTLAFRPVRGAAAPPPTADAAGPAPAEAVPRDRRAAARARAILADLSVLQREWLGGDGDPAALRRIADSASGPVPSDPVLAEAMEAAALRARVELARRETARERSGGHTVASR